MNRMWTPTSVNIEYPLYTPGGCFHAFSLVLHPCVNTGLNLSDLAPSPFLTALQSQWSLSVPRILQVLSYHKAFSLVPIPGTTFHIAHSSAPYSFQLKNHLPRIQSCQVIALYFFQTSSQSETYLPPPTPSRTRTVNVFPNCLSRTQNSAYQHRRQLINTVFE